MIRRPVFDYGGTGKNARLCALTLWPGSRPLRVRHTALTDLFVLSGDLRVGERTVSGPGLVVIESGACVELASEFGCYLLAWAEGPA